jgi:hypothetical protein
MKGSPTDNFAKRFAEHGYVCLIFSYRGYGKSEGPRWRLIPLEEVEDVKNSITYLQTREEVHPDRIGVFGISFGAAHAIYVGGTDTRAKCVGAVSAPGDGERWFHNIRRYWEWKELLKKLEKDRANRVLTGKSEMVDRYCEWSLVSDPASEEYHKTFDAKFPERISQVPVETAEKIIAYKPEQVVDKISPRPLLLIAGHYDALVPPTESMSMYEKAKDPKKLVILPGVHFDMYNKLFDEVSRHMLDMFSKALTRPEGQGAKDHYAVSSPSTYWE